MPVSVSLSQLVTTTATQPLWPGEFVDLMAKLEDDPTDATQWLVVADWLQGEGEDGLADTFRWIARHTEVNVRKDSYDVWKFRGLDPCVTVGAEPPGNQQTLAGAVAVLTVRLNRVRGIVA
jgi:uncharacterized protein (TIGR02996 family)